jgi:hypothetical protein
MHTHDDPDQLTFACPACIERVQRDQHLAAVAEQPERPLTIAWSAGGTVTLDVKYLNGEDASDVVERNSSKFEDAILDMMDDAVGYEIHEAVFGEKLR